MKKKAENELSLTAYITKYAITKGILKVRGSISNYSNMFVGSTGGYYHGEGRDWHRTIEGAMERAEEMRGTTIRSLKKKLTKLEKMEFVVHDVMPDPEQEDEDA